MRSMILATAGFTILSLMPAPAAGEGPVRGLTRIGQCVPSRIKWVGTRLEDGVTKKPVDGSGSAFSLVNGVYGVSYEQVPAVDRSRRGDPVRVCLAFIPTDCPKGDLRGREYKVTNLRTRQSWRLPDAEHGCGGA